jgi:hypothetical protein
LKDCGVWDKIKKAENTAMRVNIIRFIIPVVLVVL